MHILLFLIVGLAVVFFSSDVSAHDSEKARQEGRVICAITIWLCWKTV